MKKYWIVLSAIALFACKNTEKKENDAVNENPKEEVAAVTETDYALFGESFEKDQVLSAAEMKAKFTDMKPGDTLAVSFKSEVEKVCKKKGCWMTLALEDSLSTFVRFKDYSFFVPLNAEERETIVHGKAFITETSVDELRHYAKDAGKSAEEIAAITEPKREYAFMADGVFMEKGDEQ